jgi:hypothetical protein
MTWCDMVTLCHNTAIAPEERGALTMWGRGAGERLQAWKLERDDIYGGQPEIAAFVEILASYGGIGLVVRVWRRDSNGEIGDRPSFTVSPPPIRHGWHRRGFRGEAGNRRVLVADLLHSGAMDSSDAHYALIDSASFRKGTNKRPRSTDEADQGPDPKRRV